MSMSHFWYKLTTKAGNLFLNLEEKAEKEKKNRRNNLWIFFLKYTLLPVIRREL